MANNNFLIEHYVENLKLGISTSFLLPLEVKQIKSKLKGVKINVYKPNKDSEKVILYIDNPIEISLFEIISYDILKHQDIMGALMNLGVSSSSFGDIIITDNKYYFYSLSTLDNELLNNLNKIGKYSVKLKKVPLETLSNYERKYETKTLLTSSLRLDKIISLIAKVNREKASSLIKNKEVRVNYEFVTKGTYNLKEGDIFSIHRLGKYKLIGIKNKTKNDKLIVEYIKYI